MAKFVKNEIVPKYRSVIPFLYQFKLLENTILMRILLTHCSFKTPKWAHTHYANSEDLNEMAQNAVFHQGLYYLLRHKQYLGIEVDFNMEFLTSAPFMITTSHPKPDGIIR